MNRTSRVVSVGVLMVVACALAFVEPLRLFAQAPQSAAGAG